MSWTQHRQNIWDAMENGSILIAYAGIPIHTNEDEYYHFEVNSQFYYLTGLEREGMALILDKTTDEYRETLFIDKSDPHTERWTGHMPTKEEAAERSGITNIKYTDTLEHFLDLLLENGLVDTVYMDTFKMAEEDLPDYNLVQSEYLTEEFPEIEISDLHELICPFRQMKDRDEIDDIRKAISITKKGLEDVLSSLKPGLMEYQVQAVFEYSCRFQGARRFSFPTIAASGINGCMMHYETNHCEVKDGSLILLDLGAKYNNYCSDITRTYPANGTFSPRQRQYYDLVLKANRAVAAAARPGLMLKDLQQIARKVLGEGLIEMGKIRSLRETGKYYMHLVSHSIGINCHDIDFDDRPIEAGWIISDEPGLYIDEEGIGIRIEDDLLITENGCEVLSESIIRDPDEIEAFMSQK